MHFMSQKNCQLGQYLQSRQYYSQGNSKDLQHAPLRSTDEVEAKKDGSLKTNEGLEAQTWRLIPNKSKWKTSGHKDKHSRTTQCLVCGGRGSTWDGLDKLGQSLQMRRQALPKGVRRLVGEGKGLTWDEGLDKLGQMRRQELPKDVHRLIPGTHQANQPLVKVGPSACVCRASLFGVVHTLALVGLTLAGVGAVRESENSDWMLSSRMSQCWGIKAKVMNTSKQMTAAQTEACSNVAWSFPSIPICEYFITKWAA